MELGLTAAEKIGAEAIAVDGGFLHSIRSGLANAGDPAIMAA